MANASNGEPSKKEVRVDFQTGPGTDSDRVEVVVHNPAQTHKKRRHTSKFLPKSFERSNGNLLNPRFDSDILESYLVTCYFPQIRRMFRNSVCYVGIASFCWALYFILMQIQHSTAHWEYLFGGSIAMVLVSIAFFFFARSSKFEHYTKSSSVILAIILVVAVQLPFILDNPGFSSVATFFSVIEIVLMLYSFFPFGLYTAIGLGGFLSISYEIFTAIRYTEMQGAGFIFSKILLHLLLHIVGIFIYMMCNTRMRSNFSKIGQSVIAERDLMIEKEIKEKMIHSLMPPDVAKSVMATHPSQEEEQEEETAKSSKSKQEARGEIIFRKFQMDEMKNVSILFADIVGFTKMSSNKTAERLVGLLNDLFGRFDKLCTASGCEKISTLGDCYYCVSGCPNPCEDHAKCCVEMGLSMVMAIQAFDEDHNEEVNMRVGVHTGTVLCGIVGTRRFKFDVWSNDVTLANTMESSGEPGTVHISEETRRFLMDEYEMEEGEEVPDMRGRKELIEHYDPAQSSFTIKHREEIRNIKTFFIRGRKPGKTGIPGLEQLALERPEEIRRLKQTCTGVDGHQENNTDVPNQEYTEETESSGALDLFSQRIPDIMADETDGVGEDDDKMAEEQEAVGPDSILLGKSEKDKKDQDELLVSLIKKEDENTKAFFKPNINKIWLTFEPDMEQKYRHRFSDSHLFQEKMLSSPRYQMAVEALIAMLNFLLLAVCCHVVFDATRTTALSLLTVLGLLVQILLFLDALTNVICYKAKKAKCPGLLSFTLNWYWRNILGVVVPTIPVALVYVCMSCDLATSYDWHDRFYCFGLAVALLQFCNHTMLWSHIKTFAAIVVASVLVVLLFVQFCSSSTLAISSSPLTANASSSSSSSAAYSTALNSSQTPNPLTITTFLTHPGAGEDYLFSGENILRFEIILATLLLLLLISVVNYELEMSYRLSYNASDKAQKDKEMMQLNKDQADWLLHNIIPAHLADLFKTNRSYSMNHQDVGVIFATICNFNEFYDEMYAGGREYLRVLNELVSDYEVMLSQPEFKDVEKIKTISASFMAAAGLNEERRSENKHPYAHLFALMEYATELQNVVARFNDSIFNFNFVLNIGYNYGPVTAGVIGTTKLLYDIWGDTVNIASRMYSTGEADRIQVPQSTAELLEEKFEFSYRDEIFVKGKGMMKTFLLEKKRPGATWE